MGVTEIVCGPDAASGVTYATVGGQEVQCGMDSAGNVLTLQVSTLQSDVPVEGGEQIGMEIGSAVLLVMAGAWCFKHLSRFFRGGDGSA